MTKAEKKLKQYAKKIGVKVGINTHGNGVYIDHMDGYYVHPNFIWLRSSNRKYAEYFKYIFAHELGHAIDFYNSAESNELINNNYRALNLLREQERTLPEELRLYILQCERRASNNGRKILKYLGIKFDECKYRKYKRYNERLYKMVDNEDISG